METNEPYPLEVTNAINAFVDRIEQVLLQSGMPRSERTNVCAEVETQIHLMIERKIETGVALNLDLVNGIIESMDPPESYARSVETVTDSETSFRSAASTPDTKSPLKRPLLDPLLEYVRNLRNRPTRTAPGLDWVSVVGLASTCFGLLLVFAGVAERSEFATVSGLCGIFAGVIASGVSFWRIRHSAGLLTGQRLASIGVLMLPIVLSNAVLCALLFATPFGRVLGAIVMASALVYANYRGIKSALRWLASYSAKVSQTAVDPVEPIRKPDPDAGPLAGVIATS